MSGPRAELIGRRFLSELSLSMAYLMRPYNWIALFYSHCS